MTDSAPKKALLIALVVSSALLTACRDEAPDAYGNFEAREVIVSAEVAGRLLRFDPDEGDRLLAGAVVGQIDTTERVKQRAELLAQQRSSRARAGEAEAQIDVLRAQLATARVEHERTVRLYDAEAATAQQLNQTEGEVRVLGQRIEAARAQTAAVREEVGAAEARIDQISERIEKSRITNPTTGTVLTTYVEPGEFAQPGAPLYKIASLDTLTLRAYVSGAQLGRVRIGERVRVLVDQGEDELMTLRGRVAWIASQAEFTPTPIQTRDERTDQVYAVKIRVPNPNGFIKLGMPGEVLFTEGDEEPPTSHLRSWRRR